MPPPDQANQTRYSVITAFLFPGQGSQSVGMGADLFEQSAAARAVYEEADEQLGFSLSTLCFEGPENELTDTINQQPALFVTSMATLAVMEEQGWASPTFVAGHSLGELSALTAAQSINFNDGLSLVRRRGELMKEAGEKSPGAMAALLGLDIPTVADICLNATAQVGQPVQVANDNCPGQVVISGDAEALGVALALAQEAGARKVVRLPITIAAHSGLMASASAAFAEAVAETRITAPRIPVIGNVNGRPLATPAEIRAELNAQLTSSVLWTDTITYLLEQGVDTFVEVGPGEVLLGLVRRIDRKTSRIKFKLE